ncbi:MAG: amidohydrolase [Phycisphaeraceae bacterium]
MQTLPDIDTLIDAVIPDITAIRRDLHAHPQLGFEEVYASETVQRELTRAGVEFQGGLAETGVVGWLLPEDAAAARRPAVALRADMDALPITEQTGLPYASRHDGLMHACGHDGHTSILIGTARVLAQMRGALTRPVKLIFQPAEEGRAGARRMVEDGALEARVGGVEVAQIFGLHGWPRVKLGDVCTRPGPMMAGSTAFEIDITGPGGHGASPQETSDTIVAASHVVAALQTIVSRNVRATAPAVVTVGTFHAGQAVNIIPEIARLTGTIRTLDGKIDALIRHRVQQVAEHAAGAIGCHAAVRFRDGYPVVVNDERAVAHVLAIAREQAGEAQVHIMDNPVMGAEDFAFYGQRVMSAFYYIGVCPPDRDSYPGLHTPMYDFNDDALPLGMAMMCQLALREAV